MKISVFGIGYVGAVSAVCLAQDGHHVVGVDISDLKVRMLNEGRPPIIEAGLEDLLKLGIQQGRLSSTLDSVKALAETEISVICVGTPSSANGNLDLGAVVRVCESIGRGIALKSSRHTVVVRSTMLPGSMDSVVVPVLERASGLVAGRDFGLVYYPEFLREGSAIHDYNEAQVIVLGVKDPASERVARALVDGLKGKVTVSTFATAEAIKYTNNAWHAAKIVFANEIGTFCKSQGIDSHVVMDILCQDSRLNISPAYLKPGFAYGGSCLPKDLMALQYRAKSADLELPMLASLGKSNRAHIQRAFDMIVALGHRRIGMAGLSFKGGTDDLRESPAIELAEMLFGKGYQLRIYDQNVVLSRLNGANLSFLQTHLPHLNEVLTDDFASMVDFAETVVVTTNDLGGNTLAGIGEHQTVVDLARLPPTARPEKGTYAGICW